jgi:hypothetical protein
MADENVSRMARGEGRRSIEGLERQTFRDGSEVHALVAVRREQRWQVQVRTDLQFGRRVVSGNVREEEETQQSALIAERCSDMPVAWCCLQMKVSTSGFYEWKARPESARARANVALSETIREIHIASHGTYGAPPATRPDRAGSSRKRNRPSPPPATPSRTGRRSRIASATRSHDGRQAARLCGWSSPCKS